MAGPWRGVLAGILLVGALLPGCMILENVSPPQLVVEVDALVQEGPECDAFRTRFAQGEACHAVRAALHNADDRSFDTHEWHWSAATAAGTDYGAVARLGAEGVGPGETGNLTILIAVPLGVLLTELRYQGVWSGDPIVGAIPLPEGPETA